MPESHTGINIAAVLREAVEEWGLDSSPPLVSDNAANMVLAAKEFGTAVHIACYAHTLNLACTKALKINKVSQLLAKMRSTVAYFHRSSLATHVLKQKQTLLQIPEHKLVIDVSTRWNSSLDMINRFIEQQPAIYAALTSKELRGKANVTTLFDTDISSAEELAQILTPLKTATTILCEETVPTISMILPLQHKLQTLMTVKESDAQLMKHVKEAGSSSLQTRYSDTSVRNTLILATLLDPRFKLMPFLSDEDKLDAFHQLTITTVSMAGKSSSCAPKVELINQTHDMPALPELEMSPAKKVKLETGENENENVLNIQNKPSAMSSLFGDVYITSVELPKSSQELCEMEVLQYKKELPIAATENPLIWWKNNQQKYPILAIVARKYLCIPATSVPSERVFSTAGDIITAQRSALKPKYADMLIFLKKNWKP